MTVHCRFGLQIVLNPSSFLIATNSHAIFISAVEHRWVCGKIYFQITLLSDIKVQRIWSMLCCKDIWFSWTKRNSSILFFLNALSNTAFLSNSRFLWHEWIANHQTKIHIGLYYAGRAPGLWTYCTFILILIIYSVLGD